MTFAEHPPASDDEREALEFLKSGRRLRGFSPTQCQRVERRLSNPRRPVRSRRWLPVLAALAVAFLAGAAVAHVAGFLPLPFIGDLFSSRPRQTIPAPRRQRAPVAPPSTDITPSTSTAPVAPALGAPAVAPAERPRPARPSPSLPATGARPRAEADVERSVSLVSPRGQAPSSEPRARRDESAPARAAELTPAPPPPMMPGPALPAPTTPAPTGLTSSKPAPSQQEDAITAESRSFSAALGEWHRDHDAAAALAALDLHERRFPHGQIRLEAKLLRAEIVLHQGREREALSLLDGVALSGLPRGRELQTVRGELRVKHGRCSEGRRDLEHVLAKDRTDALARRAARALALCP